MIVYLKLAIPMFFKLLVIFRTFFGVAQQEV